MLYITLPDHYNIPYSIPRERERLGGQTPLGEQESTAQPRESRGLAGTPVQDLGEPDSHPGSAASPLGDLINQGRMVKAFLDIRAICSHKVGLSKPLIFCSQWNLLKKLLIVAWQNLNRYLFLEKLTKIL